MDEELEALVDWLRTFPDFPSTANVSDLGTRDGAIAVAKVVEELCDLSILNSISDEELGKTQILYQFLKAVTDKANNVDRTFPNDASIPFMVLVNLLDCAVQAKDKARRKTYVGRMMGLPGKSQKIIMKMIEQTRSNNTSATKRTPQTRSSPQIKSACRPNSHLTPPRSATMLDERGSAMTPPQSSKLGGSDQRKLYTPSQPRSSHNKSEDSSPSIGFLSPGTRESPHRLQTIVSRQQSEIDDLRGKLNDAMSREEELKDSIAQQEQKHRQAMMSMETQSLSKLDEVQSSLENRVVELQDQLSSATKEAQKGNSAIHELTALKEELAILEGNQSQLDEANRKLQAAKAKLQELSDVKGALLKEQEAHGKAIDDIVNLENEVNHLRPFKRQVEVYKKRAIDAEVRLVECQDCLKRLEKRATEENAHIFKDMMMQKSHLAELRQRLLDDTKPVSPEVQQGIGDGLSELNPQLKEELTRLRNENVRLRAFQSQRSDDAVQQLEESLENAEQLVEQYKSNHLSTKETLRQTQDKLKQSEQREKQLESGIKQLEGKLQDYVEKIGYLEDQCSSINAELSSAREACSNERRVNSKLQKTVNDLQQENMMMNERGMDVQQRLEETSDELATAKRKLDQMEMSSNSLNTLVDQLKDELLIKQHELESNDAIVRDTSSQLAAIHNTVVEKDQEINRLSKDISELQERTKGLTSELEDERSARNQEAEEAQQALESTRQILEQKSTAELKALHENMSSLLEDERKDNRNKQRQAQELISSQEIKWKEECKKLKENLDQIRQRYKMEEKKLRISIDSERAKFERDTQTTREECQGKIERLNSELQERKVEYDTAIECLKLECEKKKDDIVRKGKKMMALAKEKAADMLTKERTSYNELVETCNSLNERLMTAANEIEATRNKIDETNSELERYKDKLSALEREKSKLHEENEQFRRQLSGRQYADGIDAQNRLEKITKEFAVLHEEHRKLKRSVRNKQLHAIAEDNDTRPYNRSGISSDSHAMQQITQEYEKKLSDLQEEKRELIMKNSAQVTDITRIEMKVHECEKTIQFLKSENTSLKLQIQRAALSNEESNENDQPSGFAAAMQTFSPAKVAHSSPSKIPTPSKLPRRTSPSIDRAKRQKATSEEFLRSRITSLKGQSSPNNVLSPVQSKTPPKIPTPSGLKVPSPSKMAYDVHRLGVPNVSDSSISDRDNAPQSISEAMKMNSTSPMAEDPGECTQQ